MKKMAATYIGKSRKLIVDRPDGFLDGLLKRPADAHDLSDTLHATAEQSTDTAKLLQILSWNLDDNVIQTWFEASGGDLRHRVLDLVERNSQTQFSRDKRQRITGRFRCQRRRSG